MTLSRCTERVKDLGAVIAICGFASLGVIWLVSITMLCLNGAGITDVPRPPPFFYLWLLGTLASILAGGAIYLVAALND